MKTFKELLSFFIYLMIWILTFKLFDVFIRHKNLSDEEVIRICIGGIIILSIIYSSDFIKY